MIADLDCHFEGGTTEKSVTLKEKLQVEEKRDFSSLTRRNDEYYTRLS